MSSGAPFPTRYRRKFSRNKDGCLSCRSRRKKCDSHKPTCGSCLRSHVECQWPDLDNVTGAGQAVDAVSPRQLGVSCAKQDSHTYLDRRLYDSESWVIRATRLPGEERALSPDEDFGDPLQLTTPRPTNTSKDIRGSQAQYSKAQETHRSTSCRFDATDPTKSTCPPHPCRSQIVDLASPTANRIQLFNTFLSAYIPSNFLPEEHEGSVYLMYFGFLEELAHLNGTHPVLTTAVSALSLVAVGSMIKDSALIRKSSEEYSISVHQLAAAVQRPDSVHDDGLLAAIMVLATCEFYEPFTQHSQAKGYYSHILGLHSLLAARGPQPPKCRLTSLVLAKAKASSISRSMFSRQKDFHDAPGWRELNLDVPSLDQDRSYGISIAMSRIFTCNDRLDPDRLSLEEVDKILRDGASIEHALREDLDQRMASISPSTGLPVIVKDIEQFPRFCSLVADRTLSSAHRFPSYSIAHIYNTYWIRLAMLRTVVKTLQAKRSLLSTEDLPTYCHGFGKPVTDSELRYYVMCICRNLPYFAEPACASAGDISAFFPLSWAMKYFAECNDVKWSAWIEEVRQHFFARGVSFPALGRMKA